MPGTLVGPAPLWVTEDTAAPPDPRTSRQHWSVYIVPGLVATAALFLAVAQYRQFLEVSRFLWWGTGHDRHAHHLLGLSLAVDLQQGNIKHLFRDIDSARTWPPLHGIVEAFVLLAGGMDYRVGVFPSLAAWIGTAVLGSLLARRALPRGGNFAGLVAALFILASPAHRAYATDVMLESMGACLSLLAVYAYLVAVQSQTVTSFRFLALALTALFFNKYNYWLLVAFALAATEATSRPRWYWIKAHEALTSVDWRRWTRAQLRQPLNYLLVASVVMLIVLHLTGGFVIEYYGKPVVVRSGPNVVHAVYVVLFLRLALAWWQAGVGWTQKLPAAARQLLWWHAIPVALWFLWPQRLGYFLWFLSPANSCDTQHHGFVNGVRYYGQCLAADYHVSLGSALLALGLLTVGVVAGRRLRPGGRAILWLVLIAAVLTVKHPNQKSRFVHSWIAAAWVGGGMGLASLLYSRSANRWGRVRPWLGAAAVGGIGLSHLPGLLAAGHAPEAGPKLDWCSTLALTDPYLPDLDGSERTAILSSMPLKFLTQWTYLERYRCHDRVETLLRGYGTTAEEHQRSFANWLETTKCDTLVYINIPPGSVFHTEEGVNEGHEGLLKLLEGQTTFQLVRRQDLAECGCGVTVWRRGPNERWDSLR